MSVWTIIKMATLPDANGKIDFVWEILWQCSVTNAGITCSSTSNVVIDPESPEVNYTPYADLTEDQVVAWVKAALGPAMVTTIETALFNQTQAVVLPLPWTV
jgi:hypothetical protein